MGTFIVERQRRLSGEIFPGAKNEALQVICATLLLQIVTIRNIPQIADADKIIELLECMGVTIT